MNWKQKALDKVTMEREARRKAQRNMKGWRKDAIGHSIYLPQSIWKRVRAAAKAEDVVIGGFIRRAILARTAMVLGGGLAEDMPYVPEPKKASSEENFPTLQPPDAFEKFKACTHPGCDSEHLR